MRLAFSTRPFSDRSLTEAIRTIGSLGYDGVEIVADFPHALPAHVTPAVLDLVKGAIRDEGLRLPAVSALGLTPGPSVLGASWIDDDPVARNERYRYTLDCIRMAGTLGAEFVLTPAGGPWSGGPGPARSRALDGFEQNLRRLTPFAEEFGVTLLVSPGPGLLVETSLQLRHLLESLDHPVIRGALDVGHALGRGEDPAAIVRDLGPWLPYFRVADAPPSGEHLHLAPGRGAVDYAELGRALRERRFRGFLTANVRAFDETIDAAAKESIDVLKQRL